MGLYAAALVAVTVTTDDGELQPGDRRRRDDDDVEAFVDAWERSRQATFLRLGTFERRSEVTEAVISSEDQLAQRPPRRLHRQLGGVDGRDDRRTIVCPATVDMAEPPRCDFGEPAGPTYDEDVATEVAALRTLLEGPLPCTRSKGLGDGCFELAQLRAGAAGAVRGRGTLLLRRRDRRPNQQPGSLCRRDRGGPGRDDPHGTVATG